MSTTGIRTFDPSLNTTREWLEDLRDELGVDEEQQVVDVVRAVIHPLRDRLTVAEATHFAASLPLLSQGLYYQSWTPRGKPDKMRHKSEFLDAVSERLRGRYAPQEAVERVFRVLARRMPGGEIEDVKRILPEDIRSLWPA